MPGPRLTVDPPRSTPSPYGLLSVAELRGDTDGGHWQNGVTFEARCATPGSMAGSTYDECIAVTGVGSPSPPPAKADNWSSRWRGATPFTIYAEFDCAPVGLDGATNAAEDALRIAEAYQIERAFWTGQAAGVNNIAFPHLAHTGAEVLDAQNILLQSPVVTGGGPYPIQQGLGILEGLLADCANQVGIIHLAPEAMTVLDAKLGGALERRGGQRVTPNGNLVAAGNGYPGTAPSGAAPATGESWIYATGPVVVYRGPPRVLNYGPQVFDRSENTMRLLAERTALAAWACCHAAVLINLAA